MVIAKVDCTENKEGCKKYQVSGYPTLKLFRQGKELGEHMGARSVEALREFVDENFIDEKELLENIDLKKEEL